MKTEEIERKYLVRDDGWQSSVESASSIRQAYLPDATQFPTAHLYLIEDSLNAPKKSLKFHFRDSETDYTMVVLKDFAAALAALGDEAIAAFDDQGLSHFFAPDGLAKIGNDVEARVRQKDEKYFITLKARTPREDTRLELELAIGRYAAEKIFERCEARIEKTRYVIPAENGLRFEVDVFGGQNAGLVTAEIELEHSSQKVALPAWVGEDVTGDKRYSNRALAEKSMGKPAPSVKLPLETVPVFSDSSPRP